MKKIILFLVLSFSLSFAQEKTAEKLAKLSQNPLANMMSFPFQNNTTFGIGEHYRTSNVLNLQVQVFYNVVIPDGFGDWSTRLQAQILLPK